MKVSDEQQLQFIVEKHFDGQLHYDLHLQIESERQRFRKWSIPKGPSLNPNYKRLALEVKTSALSKIKDQHDHPVMVWDRGTWIPRGDIQAALRKGLLEFELQGQKLKGRWTLVHSDTLSGGSKSWLLTKRPDAGASMNGSVTVLRPEGLSQIIPELDTLAKVNEPPHFIRPQLATKSFDVPEGQDWLYEIKHHGQRIQCRIDREEIRWFDKEGKDVSGRFKNLETELQRLPLLNGTLDGQMEELAPQVYSYSVFDLLFLDGQSLLAETLRERKRRLEILFSGANPERIFYASHAEHAGLELFRQSCRLKLAGIISKRGGQAHQSGRSEDWVSTDCPKEDGAQLSLLSQK